MRIEGVYICIGNGKMDWDVNIVTLAARGLLQADVGCLHNN